MRAGAQGGLQDELRVLEEPQTVVLQGMKFPLNVGHEEENLMIPHWLVQDSLIFTLRHLFPLPAGDKHQLDHSFDPFCLKTLFLFFFLQHMIWCGA